MFYGVSVSCRIFISIVRYSYVSCSGLITSVGEERAFCLLSFTCNYVISVRRGFLFLWVLAMGCFTLLWHSLSLPYNYIESADARTDKQKHGRRLESYPISSPYELSAQVS